MRNETARRSVLVLTIVMAGLIMGAVDVRTGDSVSLSAPVPVLTWKAHHVDDFTSPSDHVPDSIHSFDGLLIEENEVREFYPFLPYIFFDSGSAEIAPRYRVFSDPAAAETFNEFAIPGGTLQKHYQVLNIVGARMRRDTRGVITLVGCSSGQPEAGRTQGRRRAERMRDYLVAVWGIRPARIHIQARGLPKHPSGNSDVRGRQENDRVEIVSGNWEIMKVVENRELRRFPQPEVMTFGMKNGIADEEVASRRIEILRDGKLWHVLGDSLIGLTDPESPEYNWGKWGNEDSIPENESPYVARLVVRSRNGVEYRSAAVKIPVMITTRHEHYSGDCIGFPHVDRYSLLLFDFNRSEINALGDRILREYVFNAIPNQARIRVTGYTDGLEPEKSSLLLSQERARAVVQRMRKYAVLDSVVSLEGQGVGRDVPLYSGDSPEGRCFNRTVQVTMEHPREEWGDRW